MNIDTGDIVMPDDFAVLFEKKDYIEMDLPPTARQLNRIPPRVGRNEMCPCGSGLKFKKCHLRIL